jgi:superfamily II DNA or RNA helicase
MNHAALIESLRTFAHTHDLEAIWDAPGAVMSGSIVHASIRSLAQSNPEFTLGEALDTLEKKYREDSEEIFLMTYAWFEAELWARRRMAQSAALDQAGAKIGKLKLGMERADLESWAVHHRVGPWLDLPLGYLSAVLYKRWSRLRSLEDCFTIANAISPGPLENMVKRVTKQTRGDAIRVLEFIDTQRAKRPKPLPPTPPDSPLAALRAALDDTWEYYSASMAPRRNLSTVYKYTALHEEDAEWPMHYRLPRGHAPCSLDEETQIALGLNQDGELYLTCSCQRNAHRPCPAKLEAVRAWQEVCVRKETAHLRKELERVLRDPAWQRQIDSLFDMLELEPVLHEGEWLGWRLECETLLKPVFVRQKKRGDGFTSRAASQGALEELLRRGELGWAERAQLLAYQKAERSYYDKTPYHQQLLASMAGQNNVYHQTSQGLEPLQITVAPIVLMLDQQQGRVLATFGCDGQALSDAQLAQLRALSDESGGVLAAPIQQGVLRLMKATGEMVRAARELRAGKLSLPSEASAYLTKRAAELIGRGDVRLGGQLQGRELEPEQVLVARLERAAQGGLSISLRMRPLKGAQAVVPGQPPELLHAVTDEGVLFTRRKLDDELALAQRAQAALGLDEAQAVDQRWSLNGPDEALVMLERLRDVSARQLLTVEWDTKPLRYATVDNAANLQLKVRTAERYFQMDGQLELDELGNVPLGQLLAAAREGRRWVQMGEDHWLKLEGQLARSVELLARASDGPKEQLNPLAAPTLMEIEQLGARIDAPPKWLQHTKKIQEAYELNPCVPHGFKAELRPYQREGYVWMMRLATWAPGAVLADDMGLGKTVQALALLLERAKGGPALVVAPASVCVNWRREAAQFAPALRVTTLRTGAEVEALATPQAEEMIIIGYDLLARHIEKIKKIAFETAVFDEAQAFKNPSTQRFKAICQVDAAFRLALTGTPVENHTGELWSIFAGAVPGLLGKQTSFAKRFQVPIERDQNAGVRAALAAMISPFVLRRLKRDVAQELPPRIDIRLDVELSGAERERYELMRRAAINELVNGPPEEQAEEQSRFKILAAITRLRQLACHPKLIEPTSKVGSSKIELLREKIAELREEGHRALVFSQFVKLLDLTREALEADGARCVSLDGSMSQRQRQEAIDAFQAGDHDVFLLSIKAGGVGLNLTAANFVFLLDPWWNPAVEDQATDRAHRIGQRQPVTVYRLVAQGTIEEAIYTLHEDKRALMDAVLSESGSARALTPEELRALLEV